MPSLHYCAYQIILKFSRCVFVSFSSLSSLWGWGSLYSPYQAETWHTVPIILPSISIHSSTHGSLALPSPQGSVLLELSTTLNAWQHAAPQSSALWVSRPPTSPISLATLYGLPAALFLHPCGRSPWGLLILLSPLIGFKAPYSETSKSIPALSSLQGPQLSCHLNVLLRGPSHTARCLSCTALPSGCGLMVSTTVQPAS